MNSATQLMKAFGLHKPTLADIYGDFRLFNWSPARLAIEYAERDHERTARRVREGYRQYWRNEQNQMVGKPYEYEAVIVDELNKVIRLLAGGNRVTHGNLDEINGHLRGHISRRMQEGAFPASIMSRYRLTLDPSGILSASLESERGEE